MLKLHLRNQPGNRSHPRAGVTRAALAALWWVTPHAAVWAVALLSVYPSLSSVSCQGVCAVTNGVRIYTAVNVSLLISALAASVQLAYFAHRLTVKGGGMNSPRPAS